MHPKRFKACDITYTDLYEESGKDEINTRIHLSQTVPTRPSHFMQQTSKTQITDEDIREAEH